MTVQEATTIVYMLHTNYPQDKNVTEQELAARINLYAVEFADYAFAIVRDAVLHWIATSKWMPTSAELLQACSRAAQLAAIPQVQAPKRIGATCRHPMDSWTDEDWDKFIDWVWEDFDVDLDPDKTETGVLPYET